MRSEYVIEEEVNHILAALTPENRLVMRTALHTGLRIGDILVLKPEQLKQRFSIVEAKTGKKRVVSLTADLLEDLQRNANSHWVFPGRDGKEHRTRQAVWKDVKRAAKAFRMPQNVSPHSARKIYAVDLMAKYGDLKRVRRALNHDNEATTMIYALADHQLAAKNASKSKKRKGRS